MVRLVTGSPLDPAHRKSETWENDSEVTEEAPSIGDLLLVNLWSLAETWAHDPHRDLARGQYSLVPSMPWSRQATRGRPQVRPRIP